MQVRDLLIEIPEELKNTNKKIYGIPDSHDQGGLYIGLNIGKQNAKVIVIDSDNTAHQSVEIRLFKEKVMKAIGNK